MGRILAFVNQKGGVGKTTSAVNLAAALQKAGKKVLLCDFDPQANATSGLGVEKSAAAHSTYELVIDGFPAADAVIHTPYCDVLASNVALSGAGVELVGMDAREYALKHALEPLRAQYDYIFIDCPAVIGAADAERAVRGGPGADPRAVRILRARGPFGPDGDAPRGQKAAEPHDLDLRGAAHHVRRPDEFLRPGRRRGAPPLPRQGVRRGHSAQRPVVRGTQPRHAVCAYDKFSRGAAAYDAVAQEILAKESD